MDIPNYVYYDSMPFCAPPLYTLATGVVYLEEREAGGELGDDGDTSNIGKEEAVAGPEHCFIYSMFPSPLAATTTTSSPFHHLPLSHPFFITCIRLLWASSGCVW